MTLQKVNYDICPCSEHDITTQRYFKKGVIDTEKIIILDDIREYDRYDVSGKKIDGIYCRTVRFSDFSIVIASTNKNDLLILGWEKVV